jgi:hypothetical protein
MKNLVLGALLAAAVSSTACTADTSARVTAIWSFNTYANRDSAPTAPCPNGYDTATVYVRPWDPFVGDFTGAAIASDFFDCAAKSGTTDPLDGVFQVWVQIENHDGSLVFAASPSEVIDTADLRNPTIELPTLFLDAGYFDVSWDLERSARRVHCSDVGLAGGQVTATVMATGHSSIVGGKFDCSDGYGVSDPLLADSYLVTLTAGIPGMDIGVSAPIDNVEVTAPNGPEHGLTHLGVVKIPVQ